MSTTTIHIHKITSIRVDKRTRAENFTWRHIILTDSDGRETKIAVFPADDSKEAHLAVIDEERQ